MDSDAKPQFQDENEQYFAKERLTYARWVKRLSYLTILLGIVHIVLTGLQVHAYPSSTLARWLLGSGVAFFFGGILAFLWSNQATKSYKASAELFQPRVDDHLTKSLFVLGLLYAGLSTILFVNIFRQNQYSPDYVRAQNTSTETWNAKYEGQSEDSLVHYFQFSYRTLACFLGYDFFFFLVTSRAAFRCLKKDNQAMSYLVFLTSILLLAASLGLVYMANYSFGFAGFPVIKAHFPMWNIRALYFVGIATAGISLLGYFVTHRSWRVGFFLLSFLLLILLVLLGYFTSFAFRHTKDTYEFYKGIADSGQCRDRMNYVHSGELEWYGCPQKYLDSGLCDIVRRVSSWEGTSTDNSGYVARTTPATVTPTTSFLATSIFESDSYVESSDLPNVSLDDFNEGLMNAQADPSARCLNEKCCGLLGQLYTSDLLTLANFGLITIVAACLVSVGCYYFWYVSWVDTARSKKKDIIWLILMVLEIVGILVVLFAVKRPYIYERRGTTGIRFLELFGWE